ncbi:MAG: type II/IV secretion system protein [Kofleriaceae bacterium]|nr:type II/IV secretion system protein [Kofleriaceae bacterium]
MPRRRLPRFSELSEFLIDAQAVRMLPLRFCEAKGVAVLGPYSSKEELLVGVLRSDDDELASMLKRRFSRPIKLVQLTEFEIDRALDVGYGDGSLGIVVDHHLNIDTPALSSSPTASEIVDDFLLHALQQNASDIHLESYPGDVDVRLRIGGVLHQLQTSMTPKNMPEVVSRLKILAKLDVAEHRRPQDGHFRVSVQHGARRYPIDFRVNVLPGSFGEDTVLRVLDPDMGLLPVEQLGMSPEVSREFIRLLQNPEGLILVTGPTGSGKTSTLYSALEQIRDGTKKIVTAEDPIEYQVSKINQKQVSHAMSMATITRAFLRHDPDVILVGEIRDNETAMLASRAATTGHLVLSTLHTADAMGAIRRLRSLGLRETEVADSVLAIVAQRLVRKICESCKSEQELSKEESEILGFLADDLSQQGGQGCEACHQSGYQGRIGVFELLVVTQELQEQIHDGASPRELRDNLAKSGHKTLLHHGIESVRAGLTTVSEILRVIPYREIQAVLLSRPYGAGEKVNG